MNGESAIGQLCWGVGKQKYLKYMRYAHLCIFSKWSYVKFAERKRGKWNDFENPFE